MDPNKALAELREFIERFRGSDSELAADLADDIVERFEALDELITKGGFLPAAWSVRQ